MIHGVGMFGPGSAGNPNGTCKGCPMAEFGSSTKGAGTACKEQRMIFFLMEGKILPMLLIVPPTSLKPHRTFGVALIGERVKGPIKGYDPVTNKPKRHSPWFGARIALELEKDRNAEGQDFNRIKFQVVEKLDDDQMLVVGAYASFIEGLIAAQADQIDAVGGETAADGGTGAPVAEGDVDIDDEGLPKDDVQVPSGTRNSAKS
jgi:hypothetical protein